MTLGIPFTDVLRILVAILLLGNIKFTDGEDVELDVKGNNGEYETDFLPKRLHCNFENQMNGLGFSSFKRMQFKWITNRDAEFH